MPKGIEGHVEKFRNVTNGAKLAFMNEASFSFGSFTLDAGRSILLKDNVPVAAGHRAILLLSALLDAGGRPVGKAKLMDLAWPGQEVEESNLSVQIATLRKVLGLRPDGREWIATVPRVGYQFLMPEATQPRPPAETAPAQPDTRPSLAVMPFTNLSAEREHEFFAQGMTDDIVAALSRVGELFVVPRSSSLAVKDRSLTAKEVTQELGVRYLLEGSVRAAFGRMRVTAQLTDGSTGQSVWAERYDGSVEDIFAFQDDLTRSIAQALQVTLKQGEASRLWEGQTKDLRAWEKAVQGLRIFHRYTVADNATARRLLEEAIALDPHYTGAMVWLTITHHWDARYGLGLDRAASAAKADECIAAIAAINPDLHQIHLLKSYSAFLRLDYDGAVRLGVESVQRAPGDTRTHGFLGMVQIYAGDMPGALESFTHAMRLCPHPDVYIHYYLAIIHIWLGNPDKALAHSLENERREPGEPYSLAVLAAVRVFRGEPAEAAAAVRKLLDATPSFSLRNIRHSELYRDPALLDRFCGLLAKAGLPA